MTATQHASDQPAGETGAVPWWRDAVVYQIYPRSFADANGDGIGDLRGIIGRLDYLADLGIDAVWLSPIFPSPMADFGYDVADYCDVDPLFGSLADLDELIAGLHARNIRLLLDWVPNHTSDQHPWFVASRSAIDGPKRDWYVWRDPGPGGEPPTNWMATFGGVPAWTYDEGTGQSYLHLFLAAQPDLNWANPEVEAAMADTLRFWLDRGVDGFRADVVHLIGKGDDVDDLPDDAAGLPILAVDRPLGHRLLARIRTLLDSYPQGPMMVGEVYLMAPGQTASYLGDQAGGEGELHLSFDFRALHTSWDPAALHAAIEATQADFAEPHWPTWVLSNHDARRLRSRYGTDARARAAAVLSLTMRGTPFLYAGEELGLADAEVRAEEADDPGGRDGCRAPIPWSRDGDGDGGAGHGWATRPWLPFPTNAKGHSAEDQVDQPGSIHSLYRELLRLRRDHEVLRRGSFELDRLVGPVLSYQRRYGDELVTVAINLGDEPAPWPVGCAGGELWVSSDVRREVGDEASLAADEAVVVGHRGPAEEDPGAGSNSPR